MSEQLFGRFLISSALDASQRLSATEAGYMELEGAVKDADCHKVEVKDGVSTKLGCCNEFKPENSGVQQFRCGNCKFLKEPS